MIDREIAVRAKTLVRARKASGGADRTKEYEYRASCERLPMLLRTAGLRRAVFYLYERDKASYDDLEQQLKAAGIYSSREEPKLDLKELLSSAEQSLASYRHLSSTAMRVALWHKRMAQALLERRKR